MSSKHQYRITVNERIGEPLDAYPTSWDANAWQIEERGAYAKLERRTIATGNVSDCSPWDGWIVVGNQAMTGWQIIAELDYAN